MELDQIRGPDDLKTLGVIELESLAQEIRTRIIQVCLTNGGHIGASLGTVELTLALHRIFESPKDSILWDVGHQAYAHKILTARNTSFSTLRLTGGISGFLSREESEHDLYGAGHSSTSISAAAGFAYQNENWTVAVIGDGALTAGVAFEALNHLSEMPKRGKTLIVLNDNQHSISQNVGGIHRLLTQGNGSILFHALGYDYLGPFDGHNLEQLVGVLNAVKTGTNDRPLVLHVMTQKGRGYFPAESAPVSFHGISPPKPATDKTEPEKIITPPGKSFSDEVGQLLLEQAG
ncbi:MAG: 1-deoxy-D-xylulose-5-phosphate synthase, partial [Proteobacteria bacterium]